MSVLSIELVWVEKYGKMGEKPPFLGIFEVWTSVSILVITWSFIIRFE